MLLNRGHRVGTGSALRYVRVIGSPRRGWRSDCQRGWEGDASPSSLPPAVAVGEPPVGCFLPGRKGRFFITHNRPDSGWRWDDTFFPNFFFRRLLLLLFLPVLICSWFCVSEIYLFAKMKILIIEKWKHWSILFSFCLFTFLYFRFYIVYLCTTASFLSEVSNLEGSKKWW